MTTDSDSECSYVTNLEGFNVIRVIIIVIAIKIVIRVIFFFRVIKPHSSICLHIFVELMKVIQSAGMC